MAAWAQNCGAYKKFVEIPLSGGKGKHLEIYVAANSNEIIF